MGVMVGRFPIGLSWSRCRISRHVLTAIVVTPWLLTVFACGDGDTTQGGSVIAEPRDEAATIYDQSEFRTFELVLAQSDLDAINASPAAEMYVPGQLIFQGQTYGNVGVRYKGSVGAFQAPCTRNGTLSSHSGPKDGKCSIKVSFNWQDAEGRFFGLKKLLFHSMNNDPSFMRERLGYAMFREMGVPAPRATHARVLINGALEGVFALVEEVDGRFTRSRFSEGGEGNLYKEIWPIHDDPQAYLNALESNTEEDPSVDRMLRFKDAVLAGPAAMNPWLDHEVMSAYLAVDRVILNDDGIFHFWCGAGGAGNNPMIPGNHNYYWYENTSSDRMWLIPWDFDLSFADPTVQSTTSAALVHIASDWTQPTQSCGCSMGNYQAPPACDPMVKNFQTWLRAYNSKVDTFIAGPFSAENVEAKLATWTQQIDSAVRETAGTNGAPSYDAWRSAIETLRTIVDNARANRGYPY